MNIINIKCVILMAIVRNLAYILHSHNFSKR